MDNSLAIGSDVTGFTFSIEFPKAKLLPAAGGSSNASTSPKENFIEGETRWEVRLDHADKMDCSRKVVSFIPGQLRHRDDKIVDLVRAPLIRSFKGEFSHEERIDQTCRGVI